MTAIVSQGFLFLVVLSLCVGDALSGTCEEDSNWMRSSVLDPDGKITIKWNFTDVNVTMMVIGESRGWIGVGFSPSGGMAGADLVIGWIMENTTTGSSVVEDDVYLQDSYATRNGQPILDDLQSYEVLNGKKNETHTQFCFTRKLNTCDKQDFEITDDSIHVIWAYNDGDLKNILTDGPTYHGPNRGGKTLNLLSMDLSKPQLEFAKTIDLVTSNYTIPNNTDTIYWCSIVKVPKMDKKSHLIMIEPHFSKGSEDLIHHIALYKCKFENEEEIKNETELGSFECYKPENEKREAKCVTMQQGWAVGSKDRELPLDVGIEFGSPDNDTYYILNIHYNIQPKHYGIVDSSGLRIYYTTNLRKYDAAFIVLGGHTGQDLIIPPHQQEFSTVFVCPSECTQKGIPPDGINVFQIWYHAHLLARKLHLHIYRNGVELQPFMEDHYDFNFQTPKPLKEPYKILPNDTLVVKCAYDSTNKTNTTLGGPSTQDEMCIIFLSYYPPADLSICVSHPEDKNVYDLTEIQVWENTTTIQKPAEFLNVSVMDYLKTYNWTTDKLTALHDLYYTSNQTATCFVNNTFIKAESRFPSEIKEFEKPDVCK